ncbi:hypothetical protein WN944_013274 [Citrus x changshan-huyou]|uniref:Uncharacterized protein n=1 Tax=Citrus x changshan-huyou TaxID=2935761 RepID=A0AAP0M3I4_9ROSI
MIPHQIQIPIQPLVPYPIQISRLPFHRTTPKPSNFRLSPPKSQSTHQNKTQDDGVPADDVKIIAKFRSRYNYIRVLEVSRKVDHPFAGARLLLLDGPGNIHSISYLFRSLTNTYFDAFATLPPILPPGPIGILGFGAGSAARLILDLYPEAVIHGWELDPSVIKVAREFFALEKLEKSYPDRLFVYVGNALKASLKDGFSGILVDLFSKGSLLSELEDPNTWEKLRQCLRKGGRIMVNVGGSCVEAEDSRRDGKVVMEATLKAMHKVFGKKLYVLSLGNRKDDSSIALTGELPDLDDWKRALPRSFGLDLLSIDQFLTCYDLVFAWKMELAGRVCHMIFLAVNVAQGRHSQERKVALDLKIWSMLLVYTISEYVKGYLSLRLLLGDLAKGDSSVDFTSRVNCLRWGKLATAIVVVFLVADTWASLADGGGFGEKSVSNVVLNRGSSSRKAFPGKEGSLGCENDLVICDKGNAAFRNLRSIPWFPPSPTGNRRNSQVSPSPPPII